MGWNHQFRQPHPKYGQGPGDIKYSQFCDGIYRWDIGRQNVSDMFNLFTLPWFTGSDAVTPSPNQRMPANVFELDPNGKTTGSGLGTGANTIAVPSSIPLNRLMYIKNVQLNMHYVNLSNLPVDVCVYWCTPKSNTVRGPAEEWNYQLQQERISQVVADQGTPTPGYPASFWFPSMSPKQLEGWRKMWDVWHQDDFILQPGANLEVKASLKYNKVASEAKYRSLTANVAGDGNSAVPPTYISSTSLVPMLIAKGFATLYAISEGVERVTSGPGKMGFYCEQKFTFSPVALEDKAQYQRVYPSLYNATTDPTKVRLINDQDVEAPYDPAGSA